MKLEKIIGYLNLGIIVDLPKEVRGGLLHKMYCVSTTTGKYAVKVLNSEIMKRQFALQNTINSEKIATALSNDIPVVASLDINDNQIHLLDGNYYMVFPWVEGESIFPPNIKDNHCRIIGDILGKIHYLNIKLDGIKVKADKPMMYDWDQYLQIASKQELQDKGWYQQYEKAINDVIKWNVAANDVHYTLAQNRVVSHRDLDPKNVMWNGMQVYIIDWEAAGYINPYQELLEVINYWACDGNGAILKEYFNALIEAYKCHMNIANVEWDKVFAGSYVGMLGWLEYNVKRALGMEVTNAEEVEAGEGQVTGTIKELYAYQSKLELINEWLLYA